MSAFMLKSVGDLVDSGITFFIPDYQRGYRWDKQQVTDLLNDILEACESDYIQKYCLQPLVVTGKKDHFIAEKTEPIQKDEVSCYLIPCEKTKDISTSFEVIDGQQRLTTIFIIIKYLQEQRAQLGLTYTITYQTREDSEDFLKTIDEDHLSNENIDYCHMSLCYRTVKGWFEKHGEQRQKIESFLRKNVYFIWYEDDSEQPVETFTRLNIGKIALTNAELIKAMLLKQSNFESNGSTPEDDFRLTQLEMATQWDEIEFTLQKDDFWYFIHPQAWVKPTRIDFIFELIKDMNCWDFDGKDLGNDSYTTFRYFYQYLKSNQGSHKTIWDEVRKIFQIFREWYNDVEFFHYIGFLTNCGDKVKDYIKEWDDRNKEAFIDYLKKKVREKLEQNDCQNLDKVYNAASGKDAKTACRPLLLLFNLQTVINQNRGHQKKYGKGGFYKFPFHLYLQEAWDIEHIDPATENELTSKKDQIAWLRYCYLGRKDKISELKGEIEKFISNPQDSDFATLKSRIDKILEPPNPIEHKDSIGNFVLLDSHTNRSYGNAIYPAKRAVIMGRDQGKKYEWEGIELEPTVKESDSSFIPPCTRNVFMKYCTPNSTDIMSWDQDDAEAYTGQIYETLKDFGVQNPTAVSNSKGEK